MGTILGHLAHAVEEGEAIDLRRILSPEDEASIAAALAKTGWANLSGAVDTLGGRFTYGHLRLWRAAQGGRPKETRERN